MSLIVSCPVCIMFRFASLVSFVRFSSSVFPAVFQFPNYLMCAFKPAVFFSDDQIEVLWNISAEIVSSVLKQFDEFVSSGLWAMG